MNFCGKTKRDTRLRVPQKEGKLRLKKIKRRYIALYITVYRFIFEWRGVVAKEHKVVIFRHRKPRFSVSAPWARRLPCAPLRGGGKGEFLRSDQVRYEITPPAKREKTAAQAIDLSAKRRRQRDAAHQVKVYWNDNIDCECRGCLSASERGKGRPR